jgi:hypothetical protein
MPMNANQTVVAILAGIGVLTLIYVASTQTGNKIVPEVQTDEDVMGLNLKTSLSLSSGTPLDTNYKIHGWHPGYDPVPTAQPVTQSRVRYPALPGGNLSTVMHKGWSALNDSAPAGGSWYTTPPEAAVI